MFRVDSGSSNDYMELQIIDGNVWMVYNIGTEDHDIGNLNVKVNDGRVHVVKFDRSGPNSTMQIDNHNRVYKHPQGGRQLTVFNSHFKVQIGGKSAASKGQESEIEIEKPFHGIISGFIYNGLRLIDLAMDGDSRVSVRGQVTLVSSRSNNNNNRKSRPESGGKSPVIEKSTKPDQVDVNAELIEYEKLSIS